MASPEVSSICRIIIGVANTIGMPASRWPTVCSGGTTRLRSALMPMEMTSRASMKKTPLSTAVPNTADKNDDLDKAVENCPDIGKGFVYPGRGALARVNALVAIQILNL